MPLLSPQLLSPKQVNAALREAGVKPKLQESVKASLDASSLSVDDLLGELGSIIRCAENDSVKLSGIKTALEMHGALNKEATREIPTINIIINDPQNLSVNPILIPR